MQTKIPFSLFLLVFGNFCGQNESKITGGYEAAEGEFPWQVSLHDTQYARHVCGGVIISEYWILTTATCVDYRNIDWLLVYSGSISSEIPGAVRTINQIVIYPDHEIMDINFGDIALLELKVPLQWDLNTQPIQMADLPATEFSLGIFTGWGPAYYSGPISTTLLVGKLPWFDYNQCKEAVEAEGKTLSVDKFCAGYPNDGSISTCGSDLGGPFVVGNILVGLIAQPNFCTVNERPSVFTDVGTHRDWIRSVAGI